MSIKWYIRIWLASQSLHKIGLRTYHNSRPHECTSGTCYNLMPKNVPIIRKPNSASKSWGHINTKSMIHDSEFPIRKIRPRQSICCTDCIFMEKCSQNRSNRPVGITSVHLMESFVFYKYIFHRIKHSSWKLLFMNILPEVNIYIELSFSCVYTTIKALVFMCTFSTDCYTYKKSNLWASFSKWLYIEISSFSLWMCWQNNILATRILGDIRRIYKCFW